MNSSTENIDKFTACVDSAIKCLHIAASGEAYDLIIQAMCINPDAPQPHNLLGIWCELNLDGDRARRHYRAAYSLDPTYKPSCKNLERISTLFDRSKRYPVDYGDEPEEICVVKNNKEQTKPENQTSQKVNRRAACI